MERVSQLLTLQNLVGRGKVMIQAKITSNQSQFNI